MPEATTAALLADFRRELLDRDVPPELADDLTREAGIRLFRGDTEIVVRPLAKPCACYACRRDCGVKA